MQELIVVKTHDGYELYCDMCDSIFSEQFVREHMSTFCDMHRHIHKQMSLDTPDLPDNLDSYPQDYVELSTENTKLCTGLSTDKTY